MKKYLLLAFLFLQFVSCDDERAPDLAEPGQHRIQTGVYYISEDSTGYRFQSHSDNKFYYLDPKPIIQVSQFTEATMSERDGYSIYIGYNDEAAKAFGDATERSAGKSLAMVVDNELVMTPRVNGRVEGNSLQITGNFTEEEILELYRKLQTEIKK